jgi:flagellar motor switch protein FliN/FliY
MADKQNNRKAARAFAAAFATVVGEQLNRSLGKPWPLEVMDAAEPPTHQEQPMHFRLSVNGGLEGECFIEFYEPQVAALLGSFVAPRAGSEELGEALAKILASATAGLRTLLAGEYGTLTFKLDRVSGLAFGGMFVVPLAAPADKSGAPVLLYFDGKLLASLVGVVAGKDADAGPSSIDPVNLKLVMDVELNVSLRFGQRQLPLREILELSSGSVIELDRMVDEPVELLLDGKLIARGEAVIVDGNYGLRVTEIPQPLASHLIH